VCATVDDFNGLPLGSIFVVGPSASDLDLEARAVRLQEALQMAVGRRP